MNNITHIRFFCTLHNIPLKNYGSGRTVFPTTGDPAPDPQGWMSLDTSEFQCPKWSDKTFSNEDVEDYCPDDCCEHWEVQGK